MIWFLAYGDGCRRLMKFSTRLVLVTIRWHCKFGAPLSFGRVLG
jgi:hypothetical protein